MTIRKPYTKLKSNPITCGEGKTKQSFKDECNINFIMKKYMRSGAIPPTNENGRYGEATGSDLFEAMQTVAHANSLFAEMPSDIRNKFDNDPVKFLDYMDDDSKLEEQIELGLAQRIPTDPIQQVEIVNPQSPTVETKEEIVAPE